MELKSDLVVPPGAISTWHPCKNPGDTTGARGWLSISLILPIVPSSLKVWNLLSAFAQVSNA